MVAEAPNGTPPVFYYIMILVCIFLYHIFLKQWFLFLEILWLGLGLNQKSMPVKRINLFFSPFLDDTFPICCVSNPYRRDLNEYYIAQMIEDCCYIFWL